MSLLSTGPRRALFCAPFPGGHCNHDTDANPHHPAPRNDAPLPRYNDSSHHARGRGSGPSRCCVSRSLGGVGCRGPRPFARRQRLARTSTRLRGDQLPTSYRHPRVGPESNDHHLSPPTDGAPRRCRPVASVQQLFQKHRCRVHRSLPSPQHAPPWTDWSRSTLTMLSFVARFMRTLWKHSSWDAWH